MNFVKPPFFLHWIYPQVTWHKSRKEKVLYLTFDDGPIPEITPWILDVLAQYDAKATFFCVGENVERYPDIFERIKREGHQIGNHTFNHLSGWHHPDQIYYDNIQKCNTLTGTHLFRPPYLQAKRRQLRHLHGYYDIIYCDVLSYDYDTRISPEKCYENVINNSTNGSIIVFHDNIKAFPRLKYTLPLALDKWRKEGFLFSQL